MRGRLGRLPDIVLRAKFVKLPTQKPILRNEPRQVRRAYVGFDDSSARVSATMRSWDCGSRTSAEPNIG